MRDVLLVVATSVVPYKAKATNSQAAARRLYYASHHLFNIATLFLQVSTFALAHQAMAQLLSCPRTFPNMVFVASASSFASRTYLAAGTFPIEVLSCNVLAFQDKLSAVCPGWRLIFWVSIPSRNFSHCCQSCPSDPGA